MVYQFRGRTKARPLSQTQKHHLESVLANYKIESFQDEWLQDYQEIWLEIGFGGGENICHLAQENPHILCIGCEIFQDGLAKAATNITQNNITNLRIFAGDGAVLLKNMPANAVQRLYVLHADPWPKTRHFKRRFINEANIAMINRVLCHKGELFVASDHEDLIGWSLYQLNKNPILQWSAQAYKDWQQLYTNHILTRYGQKARDNGHDISYLHFINNKDA